ncbi:MAG: imidazolonepropionase, partial [Woeseiaceae bacterium]|nr:imidazolonepropionase [Woeseiaceae bacterium]
MPAFDLLLADVNVATMVDGRYSVIADAGVGVADGRIAWVGAMSDLPANDIASRISLPGQWLTPALIDCHTHLVFAGNRAAEFEQRLGGASYEDIARAGGGIMSTVNATREASPDTLIEQTRRRLFILRSEGCGTVEIKSGYGLNLDVECRMLDVARTLGGESGLSVINTFLGAHTVPTEFRDRSDDYIDLVCNEIMPAIAAQNLADAVDAYCEPIAFSPDQVRRVFDCAAALNLPVKLHADQLSDSGGAALAAEFNALSADHIEYTNQSGVEALAAAGTVAVLLP